MEDGSMKMETEIQSDQRDSKQKPDNRKPSTDNQQQKTDMTYLKYIQYFYLFAAVFFIYQGFVNLNSEEKDPWLMFFFAAMAVFMFFFRRRFMNKMDNRNKK